MSAEKIRHGKDCWIVLIGPQWYPHSVFTTEAAAKEERDRIKSDEKLNHFNTVAIVPSTIYDEGE